MSIDMQQFHGVFFEESQEHLDTMEQLLLSLDLTDPDTEALNSIFRAAHSIKGGSGIFGFTALTALTHILEGLLDKLRNHQLAPSRAMLDVFLEATDVLKDTLCAYRQQNSVDDAAIVHMEKKLESFQLSDSTVNKPSDDGFGFFDDQPLETPKPADQDPFFGFFDELDASTPAPIIEMPPAAPITTAMTAVTPATGKPPVKKTVDARETASVRVDVEKLDCLINLVGEIVITQSMLAVMAEQLDGKMAEKFQVILDDLERNTREMQEAVMSVRMLPVSSVFNRFPRVVRELSSKLDKEIDLIIEGEQTELDKGLIEKLVDPLTHLVRNSIDHGIEPASVRQASGKPSRGTVTLQASRQGGNIVIAIQDDGAGLNREKIIAKALEKNIAVDNASDDQSVWQLIFAPGFSTAQQVTDISGRGVGLDVVKRNVLTLGGRIEIHSVAGQGTCFKIFLPLTLAIVDGMSVSVGNEIFIIPLANIVECLQPDAANIKSLAGQDQLLWVRDQYWPIVSLSREMEIETTIEQPTDGVIVLVESAHKHFALLVDALVGQQQVVIKSLEQHYRRVTGISGATIMGDGRVALILDIESLYENNPSEKQRGYAA